MELDAKLKVFEAHANPAVDYLLEWIAGNRDALIAQAKGRHVEGHWRYRDKLMYELSADELRAEASQEVADAINYLALALERLPEGFTGA